MPGDGGVGGQKVLADAVHADEPLVDEPEDQLLVAAPAVRIAVLVVFGLVEVALLLEAGEHVRRDLGDILAGHLAETLEVLARLVGGVDHIEVDLLR